jgi:hypothetical protein
MAALCRHTRHLQIVGGRWRRGSLRLRFGGYDTVANASAAPFAELARG